MSNSMSYLVSCLLPLIPLLKIQECSNKRRSNEKRSNEIKSNGKRSNGKSRMEKSQTNKGEMNIKSLIKEGRMEKVE